MSLVDLGKRLLDAAKRGDTDDVRTLMSNGAPFTTDWVSIQSIITLKIMFLSIQYSLCQSFNYAIHQ